MPTSINTTSTPQYQAEFGVDFDLGIDLKDFPALVDKSYRHDVCPSFYFCLNDEYFVLCTDYPDKAHREFQQASRYAILKGTNEGIETEPDIIINHAPAVFECESVVGITTKLQIMFANT